MALFFWGLRPCVVLFRTMCSSIVCLSSHFVSIFMWIWGTDFILARICIAPTFIHMKEYMNTWILGLQITWGLALVTSLSWCIWYMFYWICAHLIIYITCTYGLMFHNVAYSCLACLAPLAHMTSFVHIAHCLHVLPPVAHCICTSLPLYLYW